jgi:hypothetical protein
LPSGDTIVLSSYNFPEYTDVIGYWPLEQNVEAQITNEDYLANTDKPGNWTLYPYNINSQILLGVPVGEFNDSQVSSTVLNWSEPILLEDGTTVEANKLLPGYISFDNNSLIYANTEKVNSNGIKRILYNINNEFPSATFVFWGKLMSSDNGKNPFLSDYNYNTDKGLILSPEQISFSYPGNVSGSYEISRILQTDFARQESTIKDHWCMFVYRFTHENPSTLDELTKYSTKINITLDYWYKSGTEFIKSSLYPWEGGLNEQIYIPKEFTEPWSNVFLFGYPFRATTTETASRPIVNWELWNGYARNVLIFKGCLSDGQLQNLAKNGVARYYNWMEVGEYDKIKSLNSSSYLGTLFAYNTNNLNLNCNEFKQNISDLGSLTIK